MAAKFDEQRAASSFVFAHGSEINHCCIAYRLSSSVGVVVCCLSRKLRQVQVSKGIGSLTVACGD